MTHAVATAAMSEDLASPGYVAALVQPFRGALAAEGRVRATAAAHLDAPPDTSPGAPITVRTVPAVPPL